MRKWYPVLMLLLTLMMPARANAQSAVEVDYLDVSIWPEYDTPTVLVIYKLTLTPETSLPAEITLRLPASITRTAVVAVGDTPETVTDQGVEYKFTPGADFSRVTINATGPNIQVEYYDEGLIKNGNQRQFQYEWPGDFSVNNFHFELRQPLKSTNLNSAPALSVVGVDGEGFTFSDLKQTDLKAGEKLTFTIKYQRETDSPSTSFLQVQSSAPLNQSVPGQSTWTTYLPWALGGLGIVLLFIAGWVYLTSGRANRSVSKTRRRHAARNESGNDGDEQQVHCSQCGKRTQQGDRFCRACGARIRRGEA